MKTISIPFRKYDFRFRKENNTQKIFDIIRKKFVALTPEEFVRQNILHHLIFDMGYAKGLISIEGGLKVLDLNRRTDVIVYGKNSQPYLLIECKAPGVRLTQSVFDQAARYNLKVRAPFLAISNGTSTLICKIDFESAKYFFLENFPAVEQK